MNFPIDEIKEELEASGIVLLDQVFEDAEAVCDQLQYLEIATSYEPLKHSWKTYSGKRLDSLLIPALVFLKEVTGKDFSPELLVFEPGDYSILNDETAPEKGIVAFLDLSLGWDLAWGGYFAMDNQPVPLNPNNLLIANMPGQRWFVKRVNHHARVRKILVVFK